MLKILAIFIATIGTHHSHCSPGVGNHFNVMVTLCVAFFGKKKDSAAKMDG